MKLNLSIDGVEGDDKSFANPPADAALSAVEAGPRADDRPDSRRIDEGRPAENLSAVAIGSMTRTHGWRPYSIRWPRFRLWTLMVAVALGAMIPVWWNVWSGRRERYLELADRHARLAIEHRRNVQGLPYAPTSARLHARSSRACKRAADRPFEDFLTGRWSPDYWFTPVDLRPPDATDSAPPQP